jgi:hypothetical protein
MLKISLGFLARNSEAFVKTDQLQPSYSNCGNIASRLTWCCVNGFWIPLLIDPFFGQFVSDIDLPDPPNLVALVRQLVRLDEHTDDARHCIAS